MGVTLSNDLTPWQCVDHRETAQTYQADNQLL